MDITHSISLESTTEQRGLQFLLWTQLYSGVGSRLISLALTGLELLHLLWNTGTTGQVTLSHDQQLTIWIQTQDSFSFFWTAHGLTFTDISSIPSGDLCYPGHWPLGEQDTIDLPPKFGRDQKDPYVNLGAETHHSFLHCAEQFSSKFLGTPLNRPSCVGFIVILLWSFVLQCISLNLTAKIDFFCTRLQTVWQRALGSYSGAAENHRNTRLSSCCQHIAFVSQNRTIKTGTNKGFLSWLSAIFITFFRCKPGPKSRGKLRQQNPPSVCCKIFFLCCLTLIANTTRELVRSEGCVLVMEDAEALTHEIALGAQHVDAKPHDMRPETCSNATRWLPASRQIVKRSLKRAYARSLQHGISWYRGRSYTPQDFPRALRDSYQPSTQQPPAQSKPLISCNKLHTDKKRFRVLNWNAGGLGAFRVDELKFWMLNQCIEVAFITETRWCFENTWMDEHFHFIHTGDPSHKGMGILCILAKHFCPANCLRWRPVVPGRILHVQVQHASRCVDLVGCYQHTSTATRQCQYHREQLWAQLDLFLHGLVQRNILVLAGDFNCDLLQSTSHSGPDKFYWNRTLTRGATHADNGRFTTMLRDHGLTALNSWHPQLGPTFVHADTCSRIDFIITRKHVADGAAKQVTYAWDAPFQGSTGHAPMVANLRKQWFQAKRAQNAWGVTPQQRKQCQFAYQTNAPEWQEFAHQAATRLRANLPEVLTLDDALIPQLHHMANQSLHEFFPHARPSPKPHDSTFSNIVLNKWQHRRALMRLTTQTLPNMFHAWMHLASFAKLNRRSKQHAKTVRKHRFDEVIQSASHAAQRHDSKTLFAIINKFSPKPP